MRKIALINLLSMLGFILVSMVSVVPELRDTWNAIWMSLLGCSLICSLILAFGVKSAQNMNESNAKTETEPTISADTAR